MTGKKTSLVATARRALRALNRADVPFAVIGATALGVRGLARFTADLDVVVAREDAFAALTALDDAGFAADPTIEPDAEPEAMYVMRNQPRHLGDLARIVLETTVDLALVERYLAEVHPEMLGVLKDRVEAARHPAPAPPRPPRRRRS